MSKPTPIPATAEIIILSVRTEMKTSIAISAAPKRRSPKYGDHGAHPMAAEIADKLGEEFAKRNIKI